jgi:hypothetical protein
MEEVHQGKNLIFAFDNSSNHHAKALDDLCEKNLNLNFGGKNVKNIRDSNWNGEVFHMQRADGVQKGIKSILIERGAWFDGLSLTCKDGCPVEGNRVNMCCARKLLS